MKINHIFAFFAHLIKHATLSFLAFQFYAFQQRIGISAQQMADFYKFDDVQPTIVVFSLRYKRLGTAQLVGKLLLSHSRFISRLYQKLDKRLVGSFIN
jgi:hypothetical protein